MSHAKKIDWLSILQGWAMLWVVIGHSRVGNENVWPQYANLLYDFASSFHMPLFIFISGYLFYLTRIKRKWKYMDMIKEKIQRLGIPFVVFTAVALVLKSIFSSEMERPVTISVSNFLYGFLYPADSPMAEMWFIASLFWMFLLEPLWKLLSSKHVYSVIGGLLLYFIFYLRGIPIELFCINRASYLAFFFFGGVCFARYELINYFTTVRNCLILFFISVLLYTLLYSIEVFPPSMGIIMSISLSFLFERFYSPLFSSFRNYTYQIFLLGIFGQVFVNIIFRHTNCPYIIGYIAAILVGIYMPVLVSKIVEYINWKPLKLCIGLK